MKNLQGVHRHVPYLNKLIYPFKLLVSGPPIFQPESSFLLGGANDKLGRRDTRAVCYVFEY
jgi:hypothetical protein